MAIPLVGLCSILPLVGKVSGIRNADDADATHCRPLKILLQSCTIQHRAIQFDFETLDKEAFLNSVKLSEASLGRAAGEDVGYPRWWTWPDEGPAGKEAPYWLVQGFLVAVRTEYTLLLCWQKLTSMVGSAAANADVCIGLGSSRAGDGASEKGSWVGRRESREG